MTKNQTTIERKSDRELVVTRTINGPARLVFDAWTKPELLLRWWAPRSAPMKLIKCEVDLRVGGKYRFVFEMEDKNQHSFFGTYKEIERPLRLAWTDEEDAGEAMTTVTFTEKDGKTTVIATSLHASKDALDGALKMGMEPGTRETFDQLEELISKSAS